MTDDIVLLYGKTKLPADDCKVIFKDKFKEEHVKLRYPDSFKCLITISGKTKRV